MEFTPSLKLPSEFARSSEQLFSIPENSTGLNVDIVRQPLRSADVFGDSAMPQEAYLEEMIPVDGSRASSMEERRCTEEDGVSDLGDPVVDTPLETPEVKVDKSPLPLYSDNAFPPDAEYTQPVAIAKRNDKTGLTGKAAMHELERGGFLGGLATRIWD